MKDVTVRQLEMANRVVGFLRENPIAFHKGSDGAHLKMPAASRWSPGHLSGIPIIRASEVVVPTRKGY